MRERPIIVFASGSSLQETHQFLSSLERLGFVRIDVIATPTRELAEASGAPSRLSPWAHLSEQFGYSYTETDSGDPGSFAKKVADLFQARPGQKSPCPDIALLVPGSEPDLQSETVRLFEQGIVQTFSGRRLNASATNTFSWMVESGAWPGTSVQFLGPEEPTLAPRVFFEHCEVEEADTPDTLRARLVVTEQTAWNRLLSLLMLVPTLKQHPPAGAMPSSPGSEKTPFLGSTRTCTSKQFQNWKNTTLAKQDTLRHLFRACAEDDLKTLTTLLTPELLATTDNHGRTPLLVAAFHQSIHCVRHLIDQGADVNATNDKGTSVLMYAKTKLLHQENRSLHLLKLLIEAGADKYQQDLFGKDVFFYIASARDPQLAEALEDM